MSDTSSSYLSILFARWPVIAIAAVVGTGAAAAYAFTAPVWYEARLSVVPSERGQDMSVLSKLPNIGALGGAAPTDAQRIRAVLTSHSVADEVIKKFNLKERYGLEHMQKAREALWAHCRTGVDKKSGIVELLCEDKDPEVAMNITAHFGEIGNEVFKRISASSAREERRFLEAQVARAKKDVDDASVELRKFQEKHKLIDLPEQAKAVISAMATIQGEMLSKQLELSYLTSFSSRTESSVVQLQQRIAVLRAKMKQLEESPALAPPAGGSAAAPQSDFFPEAMRVPELRFQLEQLVREQKIRETLFFLMSQRYETARADEARDTSTFQILDQPTLPTYKSRPKRLRIMLGGCLFGLVLGSAFVVARSWMQRRRMPIS